jgi:hypothetical protein
MAFATAQMAYFDSATGHSTPPNNHRHSAINGLISIVTDYVALADKVHSAENVQQNMGEKNHQIQSPKPNQASLLAVEVYERYIAQLQEDKSDLAPGLLREFCFDTIEFLNQTEAVAAELLTKLQSQGKTFVLVDGKVSSVQQLANALFENGIKIPEMIHRYSSVTEDEMIKAKAAAERRARFSDVDTIAPPAVLAQTPQQIIATPEGFVLPEVGQAILTADGEERKVLTADKISDKAQLLFTEDSEGRVHIEAQVQIPSTNFAMNRDGTIGEQITSTRTPESTEVPKARQQGAVVPPAMAAAFDRANERRNSARHNKNKG